MEKEIKVAENLSVPEYLNKITQDMIILEEKLILLYDRIEFVKKQVEPPPPKPDSFYQFYTCKSKRW